MPGTFTWSSKIFVPSVGQLFSSVVHSFVLVDEAAMGREVAARRRDRMERVLWSA